MKFGDESNLKLGVASVPTAKEKQIVCELLLVSPCHQGNEKVLVTI